MNWMQSTALVVGSACLLTSCYFNSAGYIFDKTGYRASVNTNSVKVGSVVYRDSADNYYVELPRYRYEKPVKLNYFFLDDDDRKPERTATGQTDMFRIPQDFAMYLTGSASTPSTPSYMRLVEDADEIKAKAVSTLPIVRAGDSSEKRYSYDSPNAAWWYTLGVFEWLIVDLPLTCVENSLFFCAFLTAKTGQAAGGVVKIAARAQTEMNVRKRFTRDYPCPGCSGRGTVGVEYVTVNSYTGATVGSGYESKTCSTCGGSGLSSEGEAAVNAYMQQYDAMYNSNDE